jgi:NAD(P)-dependent dehydrogenase (short-subunit alcohol dehydrogenase family)
MSIPDIKRKYQDGFQGLKNLRKRLKWEKRERCLIVDKPHEFLSRSSGQTREEVEKRVKGLSIQGRMIDPDEVAALALFLVSDVGKGITGRAINIDGGQVMH